MGGNKQSRPLAESARIVLARRQAPRSPLESAVASATKTVNAPPNVAKSPLVNPNQNFRNSDALRPEEAIIKEMSKWDFIKTTNVEVQPFITHNIIILSCL
jgi:hypothetical protein